MEIYGWSVVGILTACAISLMLAVYSGISKGRAGLLAGPVADMRDDNRLYRIDRVHMNSVEALTPFAVSAVLGMLVGADAGVLASLIWLHVALRAVHLAIYLRGGEPAKGGKLRTILYVLSGLVTLGIIGVTGWAALA
jgi:uncharacterized MAPEG superfamily protein